MNWNVNMKVDEGVSLPYVETLQTNLMCALLRDCLNNRTIRGVFLTKFIEGLKQNISEIQIYMVGGAPRDILKDGKVDQIHFAVNAGYFAIKQVLSSILTVYNALPEISHSDLERKYTILSIPGIMHKGKMEGTIKIGPLKGCLVPKELRRDTLYTSCSDVSCDSKSRDFTVNSIYVDVTNWKVLDPLGGLKSLSAQNKIELRLCCDTPLQFNCDPNFFPVPVSDYNDVGSWMRGLRFRREQVKYDVLCFPDIVERLTNYLKGLIHKLLKLKEEESKDKTVEYKNCIREIETFFNTMFDKLWKKNNIPSIEDIRGKAMSLGSEVEYQNSDWLKYTYHLAFLVREVAHSQSTGPRFKCVREGIIQLSVKSGDTTFTVPYQDLLPPPCPRPDPLTALEGLVWQTEQDCSNLLATFKETQEGHYLNQFMNERPESVENQARQSLGIFWDKILSEFFNDTLLWEKSHWYGLLMKAWNHLCLVEPFDEAAHLRRFNMDNNLSGYWNSSNRPRRYIRIEEKILAYYGTGYRTRNQILRALYPGGIPNDVLLCTHFKDGI
eukprot:TRINITY_DN853_c0_g2_i6.p1 TRINITY_DN853_c0_g2~~TRINITY_DN853_c0_g2_i6.p1  ORF type:complete len:553 (-),score=86.43 TRINITY_DN853_c0_g2_i6:100-1758(-)